MSPAGHLERAGASLLAWLRDQDLVRGPFLYVDYWASVFGLETFERGGRIRDAWVDRGLFRAGVDRPDLELPRARYYLLLFVAGPLLMLFRPLARLGRFRVGFEHAVGREVRDRLTDFRLGLLPSGPGRVDVEAGGETVADDVVDPFLVGGFASFFYATYKLPLAALSGILLVGVGVPALHALGLGAALGTYWLPVGFPVLALGLWAVYRDVGTALLGAAPVIFGRYLFVYLNPVATGSWAAFALALGAVYGAYLAVDAFFMPRPLPPALMLYQADGPGHPYRREGDAPWWLEGETYWVWRYLVLSPAELNKPWERDWERVELWVRADGEDAGQLEWVVTDAHYREIWLPADRLDSDAVIASARNEQREARRRGEPGVWVVEVDTAAVMHGPFVRGVTYLSETDRVPSQSVAHLARAFWRSAAADEVAPHAEALDRIRVARGEPVLGDVPEHIHPWTRRYLLGRPWSHWRYPFGASTLLDRRRYAGPAPDEPPLAADPDLQIKAPRPPAS